MKKLLVFIVALFYLSITSGIEVNWHYCMGKLASVAWGEDHNDQCARCGMKDKAGCCETVSQFVKVTDAHQWTKLYSTSILTLHLQSFPIFFPKSRVGLLESKAEEFVDPPPVAVRYRPSFLQVFRI